MPNRRQHEMFSAFANFFRRHSKNGVTIEHRRNDSVDSNDKSHAQVFFFNVTASSRIEDKRSLSMACEKCLTLFVPLGGEIR